MQCQNVQLNINYFTNFVKNVKSLEVTCLDNITQNRKLFI